MRLQYYSEKPVCIHQPIPFDWCLQKSIFITVIKIIIPALKIMKCDHHSFFIEERRSKKTKRKMEYNTKIKKDKDRKNKKAQN